MITAVAVVPSAPALLPRYTGRVDALADLRAAAVEAVRAARAGADRVVLVAATDRDPRHTMAPLGQRVGEHLLDLAGGIVADDVAVVPWDSPVEQCRTAGTELGRGGAGTASALVVVADGSARRGEKAPGHLDERAFAFDDALVGALRGGDPATLLDLDPVLGADLLAHGRVPLQVAAAAMGDGGWRCERCDTGDAFGVLHVVALLRRG